FYVNGLAAQKLAGGEMFPQDEFYDVYMQQVMSEIAGRAPTNARVAGEIPSVSTYYANRAGRPDLICVELSDPAELARLRPGDFVIDARGRTYFSNQAMLMRLRQSTPPAFTVDVGTVPAAGVHVLDQKALAALQGHLAIVSLIHWYIDSLCG